MADDDRALVADCLRGRVESFELLVTRHQKTIFNVILRMVGDYDDARDIAQAAFVKAFENLNSYNSSYEFFSWLYRIDMNEAINHLNRKKRQVPIPANLASHAPNPAEALHSKEVNVLVQNAISELSIDYRAVLVLKHFTDMSMRELAYILEIPVKRVKSRLYTARQRLCEILKSKGVSSSD